MADRPFFGGYYNPQKELSTHKKQMRGVAEALL